MRALWFAWMAVLVAPAGAQAQVSDQAREAVAHAQSLYEANRFEEAGAAFEAAYDVTAHPSMIYNAYVAYRDAGLPREAARTLRRHLALISQNDPERARLEARLRGLEQQLARPESGSPGDTDSSTSDSSTSDSSGSSSTDTASSASEGQPGPASSGGPDTTGPWVTLLAGAGVLVAGGVVAGVTLAEHTSFESDCAPAGCPELEDDASRGQALALTSDILLAVGGTVAAVGLVWLIVELASGDDPAVALRCGPLGCGAAF